MFELPLALGDRLHPGLLEAAILGANLLKGVVGLAIAYVAYEGYRRNRSRPMLILSGGFALTLGIPVLLVFGGMALVSLVGLPTYLDAAITATSEICQVVGLFVILYAIRM